MIKENKTFYLDTKKDKENYFTGEKQEIKLTHISITLNGFKVGETYQNDKIRKLK